MSASERDRRNDLYGWIDSAAPGELLVQAGKRARQNEMRNVGAVDAGLFEQTPDRGRDNLGEALVANPAFLPTVVELFGRAAKMIDKVYRERMRAKETGNGFTAAERAKLEEYLKRGR